MLFILCVCMVTNRALFDMTNFPDDFQDSTVSFPFHLNLTSPQYLSVNDIPLRWFFIKLKSGIWKLNPFFFFLLIIYYLFLLFLLFIFTFVVFAYVTNPCTCVCVFDVFACFILDKSMREVELTNANKQTQTTKKKKSTPEKKIHQQQREQLLQQR